jgi:hypothetical protein
MRSVIWSSQNFVTFAKKTFNEQFEEFGVERFGRFEQFGRFERFEQSSSSSSSIMIGSNPGIDHTVNCSSSDRSVCL